MKEIYSFTVELEKKSTKDVEKTIVDKTTGKEEKVKVAKEVIEKQPYRIVLREPNRRMVEEADMEYSIEMSQCVKKGILTKAMLANKYTDSGGLIAENDARTIAKQYTRLGELESEYTRISTKTGKKTEEDEQRISNILQELGELRRSIVDLEGVYASLFNHTADTKAQNRVILWYVLNLTYFKKDEDEEAELEPFFKGETFDEKESYYYTLDETNDELYSLIQGKVATFLSYWYFSTAATREDFDRLNEDIESGNV
tara:strand:+ start:2112 stop:2882 length:771 start_codon:yes stop_codon:yes gene_type:complete